MNFCPVMCFLSMQKPRISIIAALASNRAIGKNNGLLWNIPEDMKHFRELTTNHTVIMGQKTYESIGRLLPNRINIVVTFDHGFVLPESGIVCYSLDEALEIAQAQEKEEVFIIGGASVYKQMLPYTERLYLTLVKGNFDGDVFFPSYEETFQKTIEKRESGDDRYRYTFITLEK